MKLLGLLQLRDYPGPIPANLKPPQRLSALETRDRWASDTRAGLGELSRRCVTSLKVGGGAAGSGLALALAGSLAGWSAGVVAGAMGLVALGMVVSLGSRVIQDKAQNRLGKVLTYAGQIAIALERERKGLDPGARPEDARQTVVGLLQASRSGLLEHEGYLAMPGVRLRKR